MAGPPQAAGAVEESVDSVIQDVALRKARLADNMQQYLDMQQKAGGILNQVGYTWL